MGEVVDLQGELAGQFSLNDFLGQLNNAVTPQNIVRTILPVQEMRHFQRRYFSDTGERLAVGLGLRLSLRWTVPNSEWWKPLALVYHNKDTVLHNLVTRFSMQRNSAALVWQASNTNVLPQQIKVVYGSDLDESMSTGGEESFMSRIPVVMEPSDTFDLVDLTAVATGGITLRWIFAYERVPRPATTRVAGVVAAVTLA